MNVAKILSIALIALCPLSGLFSQGKFEFTPLARDAYEKTLALRFDEANLLIARLKLEEPGNLFSYYFENYIDFFKLYITEDGALYKKQEAAYDARLEKIEKSGDPKSPYTLFTQANMRLQWALIRLRFEDYLAAFNDVNKANKLLERNTEAFPDFMPNRRDLGLLHAMVGTIPNEYKWGVKLLSSLDGTIEQGRKEVEEVLNYADSHDFVFGNETRALYAFLLLHLENDGDKAWKILQEGKLEPAENPMHCFVLANIAMRTGKNDEAVRLLENKPDSPMFFPFPYMDYMLGLAKLRRLDKDAGPYIQRFLDRYKGRHYIKEAYQKLAWQALINGRPEDYRRIMVSCLDKGHAVAGGDKSALQEAREGRTPDADLLRSRLLFDGGYYTRARDLLAPHQISDFPDQHTRLEFNYRMGRIEQGLKNNREALRHYKETIREGEDSPWFFACNAALQSGLIYEKLGDKAAARSHFQLCIKMNPVEYADGLHQQAKAGLARIR